MGQLATFCLPAGQEVLQRVRNVVVNVDRD